VAERRRNGALEEDVLSGLWAAGRPLTARDLQRSLVKPLAYTTVMTTLTRLGAKGLVVRSPISRGYEFAPTGQRGQNTAAKMQALVEEAADPTAALACFASVLTKEQVRVLRAALEKARRA